MAIFWILRTGSPRRDLLEEQVNGERFTASGNPLAWPVNLAGDNGYQATWFMIH